MLLLLKWSGRGVLQGEEKMLIFQRTVKFRDQGEETEWKFHLRSVFRGNLTGTWFTQFSNPNHRALARGGAGGPGPLQLFEKQINKIEYSGTLI